MITTKLKRFLDKLIEDTMNGNIQWESAAADGSSYKCSLNHDIVVQVSVINLGNSKEAILKINRESKEVNINLAPRDSEINKSVVGVFESVYSKVLNKGLEMLEEDEDNKIDIIKDAFAKEETVSQV